MKIHLLQKLYRPKCFTPKQSSDSAPKMVKMIQDTPKLGWQSLVKSIMMMGLLLSIPYNQVFAADVVITNSPTVNASSSGGHTLGQSFKATKTGVLSQVEIVLNGGGSGTTTLTVYEGEGTGGRILYTKTGIDLLVNTVTDYSNYTFHSISIDSTVNLTNAGVYTINLSPAGGMDTVYAGDTYGDGQMYVSEGAQSGFDMVFKVTQGDAAPTNATPVATAPSVPSVTEGDTNVVLGNEIDVADADGDDQTVTFSITGGTLTLGTTGVTFAGGGNGSASFTAAGTLSVINTALDVATFTPTANLSGTNAGTISFTTHDGTIASSAASVTFDIAATIPEINLQGNGTNIADGDITPTTSDHTDFGSHVVDGAHLVRTFTIQNTGSGVLDLMGSPLVAITGSSDFSVTSQPASDPVSAAGSTIFQVTLDPTTVGTQNASISIANDDADENPYNFSLTASVSGFDADGTLTAASGVTEPIDLNATDDSLIEARDLFDFTLTDGGGSDATSLDVIQVVVHVNGTSNDVLRGDVTWRLNGPDVTNDNGTYNAGTDTITFSGINISVPDGGSETYTINAYMNTTNAVTDNATFILSIDGDTDLTMGSGTTMASSTSIDNGTAVFEVTADELVLTTAPAGSVSGMPYTTQPVVTAEDEFGNTDLDFNEVVTAEISAMGDGSVPGAFTHDTVNAVAGVATFINLTHTADIDQQGIFITFDDESGVGANLNTINTGGIISTDVVATKLLFSTQPTPLSLSHGVATSFTAIPVVTAVNADDVTDTGYTSHIVLTQQGGSGSFALTGTGDLDGDGATVTLAAVAGVTTFAGSQIHYSLSGVTPENFVIRATSGGLTLADSSQLSAAYPSPTVSSVTYDTTANSLVVTGANFVANGGGSDVDVSDLTITGQAGASRTLLTSSDVSIDNASQFTVTLTGADIAAVEALLNRNGTASADATDYNLAAADDFMTFLTDGNTSDLTLNAITVSNILDVDGRLTAGVITSPVAIGTTIDTAGEAIDIFDFTLTDGGATDSAAMVVSNVVLTVSGTSNDSQRGQVVWRLNGAGVSHVTGVYNAGANTITFSGLTLSVADNTNEVYTVNAYFSDNTSITDNATYALSIDGDTDITVSSGTQMAATSALTNGAGGIFEVIASQLAFTTQPAGSVSGEILTTQPVVVARDSFANIDTDFTEIITLTENGSGTISGDVVTMVAGVATFTALNYSATADQEGFTLTVNDQDSVGVNLGAVNTNALTSDVVATSLAFTTQPAGSVSGSHLTTQPVITARDAGGLTDTGFTETITLTEASAGSLSGGSVAAVAGVATFTAVNYSATADQQSFTLTADDDTGVGTNMATVNASAVTSDVVATSITFSTQPAGSVSGVALTTQPVVNAINGDGITDTGFTEIITLTENGSGVITGSSVTAVAGVATFTALNYSATADQEGFTLTAEDQDGLGVNFSPVNANALTSDVVATSLAFTTQPAGSVSGSHLTTQPVITARDAGGLTDTGFTETITLTEASAGSLSSGSVAAVAGVATFTAVNYSATADQQSFTLTADDDTGVGTNMATVNASAVTSDVVATNLVFNTQPSPLTIDNGISATFSPVPVVSAVDANGNVDTGYTSTITLSEVGGAGGVMMSVTGDTDGSNSTVTLTPQSGQTTFTGMQITYTLLGLTDESFNLRATSGGLTVVDSSQMTALADVVAPTVAEVSAVTTPSNNTTPTVTLLTNEAGTLNVGGSCGSLDEGAISAGSTTITLTQTDNTSALASGTYSDCSVSVTDAANNANSPITLSRFTIDAIAPTTTSVNVPSHASYAAGQHLDFTVNFGKNITVNTTAGTPQLAIIIGSTVRQATYQSGTGSSALLFRYTVQTGEADTDGITVDTLDDNDGTLRDAVNNDATLTLNNVATTTAVLVDTTAPTVALTSDATPQSVSGFTLTVTFSEVVNDFVVGDIVLSGGSLSHFATADGGITYTTSYTASVTPPAASVVSFDVAGSVAQDIAGNANTAATQLSVVLDDVAPNLSSSLPTHTATNIAIVSPSVVLNFDEDVVAQNAGANSDANSDESAVSLILISDNSVVETITADNTSINGDVVTVNFTSTLLPNTEYGISIGTNAFADAATNLYTGLSANNLRFTTANNAPVANNDSGDVNEDASVQIDVLDNDTDSEGFLLPSSTRIVSAPTHGSTSINTSNGVITYTPTTNFNGDDSFTYQVNDSQGGISNIATVNVTVAAVNDTPVMVNDMETTNEDTAVVIDVLVNDSDIDDGDTVSTIVIDTQPSNGSVTIINDNVDYQPNSNFSGTDSFTYHAQDNNGVIGNSATVTINVTSDNDLPVATNDIATTNEDTAVIIDVLNNDSDIEDGIDITTVNMMSAPSQGSLSINETNGEITYTPNANVNGSDSFSYVVKDTDDGTSNEATVSITITEINDAPIANNDTVSNVIEDVTYPINVLGNDSDVENSIDSCTVTIVSQPSEGLVSVDSHTGFINYTPTANYFGEDSFTYTVNDDGAGGTTGSQQSNVATVNLSITSVNDVPLANDDSYSATEDSSHHLTPLENDSDVDGSVDETTLAIVQEVANGSLTVNNDGSVEYTPVANYVGNDSFTYTVNDNEDGSSNEATVSITVTNVNDAPTISSTTVTEVDQDSDYQHELVANDIDNGDTLTITSDTALPTWLTLTDRGNGTASLMGSPSNNDVGEYAINLTVTDNSGATDTQAFVITVSNINDDPMITIDNTLSTDEDNSQTLSFTFSDIDGDTVSASIANQGSHGVISVTGTTISYVPNTHFNGNDSFTLTLTDSAGFITTQVIDVTVSSVNDAPTAIDDRYTLAVNEEGTYALSVLQNDTDIDNDSLTIEWASSDDGSVLIVDNVIVLTTDTVGAINLNYGVSDGAESSIGSVTLITEIAASESVDITAPTDVEVNASGLFTKVNIGSAVAVDSNGNALAVSLDRNSVYFAPGLHTIYWNAEDSEGHQAQASQTVTVHPQINISKDAQTIEGATHRIGVYLNGPAPRYPVTIAYTVSGSSDSDDHDLVDGTIIIESGTEGMIKLSTYEDESIEGEETLIVTLSNSLSSPLNVGSHARYKLTIDEGNIAPDVYIAVTQENEARATIQNNADVVTVTATVVDLNADDTHDYRWINDNVEIVNESNRDHVFVFSPQGLSVGYYHLQLVVTDNNDAMITANVYMEVTEVLAVLSNLDSDGDLLPDDYEGYSDGDGDGIADYADAINECNIIQQEAFVSNRYLIEGESSACLRKGIFIANNDSGATLLNINELNVDNDADNIGGIFDFVIYNLPMAGQAYQIVLPQRLPIPSDAVYRKYKADNTWGEFQLNNNNYLSSAKGEAGYCPPPGDREWIIGLNEGDWCVQITIEDGGVNDDDGLVNGTIVDPGGVSSYVNNTLPLAVDDTASIITGNTIAIDVLNNDSDVNSDTLSLTSASAQFGSVTIENALLHYTPLDGFIGIDIISYGMSDSNGGSASADVTVTVKADTLDVVKNSAGGSMGSLLILILGTCVMVRYRGKIITAGILALVSVNSQANWFVEAELGSSFANNEEAMNERYVQNKDRTDLAWAVGVGCQLTPDWAITARYLDLGKGSATLNTDNSIDPDRYHEIVAKHSPALVEGLAIEADYSLFKKDKVNLQATAGLFSWGIDFDSEYQGVHISSRESDIDPYIGMSADYTLSKQWKASLAATQYFIDLNNVTTFTLKLSYQFGSGD